MEGEQSTQTKETRRSWKAIEEEALLTVLEEVVANGGRCDNGSFKSGTMIQIEKSLQQLCPDSGLKANPHIDSKMRKWKKQYGIVYDMMNKSGFAWNEVRKCIEVDSEDVWQAYVQQNKDAEGWKGKSFPIYDRLAKIFGKDRATSKGAKTPAEMVEELNREEENQILMEEMEAENNPPIPLHNRLDATSSLKRKRSRSKGKEPEEIALTTFEKMFEKSIEQLNVITDKFVKGNEDRSDIAAELQELGLSEDDQLDVLQLIVEKPQNVTTFKSTQGPLRERFVMRLLKQMRGD